MISDIKHWSKGFQPKGSILWEVSNVGSGSVVNMCGLGQMQRPFEITLPVQWVTLLNGGLSDIFLT